MSKEEFNDGNAEGTMARTCGFPLLCLVANMVGLGQLYRKVGQLFLSFVVFWIYLQVRIDGLTGGSHPTLTFLLDFGLGKLVRSGPYFPKFDFAHALHDPILL